MKFPMAIPWIENCAACTVAGGKVLCGLSGERLTRFENLAQTARIPKGALVFLDGEMPRGIHILCAGRVKLSSTNPDGRRAILTLAGPGDILGAREVLLGRCYDMTAEALEPSQLRFLRKDQFLGFLSENGDVCLRLAGELSGALSDAYEQMRALALGESSMERLVRLLRQLAALPKTGARKKVSLGIELSREEIGQMIGATRETASRLLAELARRRLIRSQGRRITIVDLDRLQAPPRARTPRKRTPAHRR